MLEMMLSYIGYIENRVKPEKLAEDLDLHCISRSNSDKAWADPEKFFF